MSDYSLFDFGTEGADTEGVVEEESSIADATGLSQRVTFVSWLT